MEVKIASVGDNYVYVVVSGSSAVAVDPTSSAPVFKILEKAGARLEAVMVSHNHGDHTWGCSKLESGTGCATHRPGQGGGDEDIVVGGVRFSTIHVPGHTLHDVAYYAQEEGVLFTGDTLFVAGCGRVFSGDYNVMWESLKKLRVFPADTKVYVGHDYTVENLEFAVNLEPDSQEVRRRLVEVRDMIKRGEETVPTTIQVEKLTNPFLRCDDPDLQAAVGMRGADPAKVFREIRSRKDRW